MKESINIIITTFSLFNAEKLWSVFPDQILQHYI